MDDTDKPATEAPAAPPTAATLEDYQRAIAKYDAATAAYHSASRYALEKNTTRQSLGLSTLDWEASHADDKDEFVARLESELYDGARAIAYYTGALETNGGGRCAQLDKLCQAAVDLALYALRISHLKHSDEAAVEKVIVAARAADREAREKARLAVKVAEAGLARKAQRDEESAAARKKLEDERAALQAQLDPMSATYEARAELRALIQSNLLPDVAKRERVLDQADALSNSRDWTTEPI